MGDTPSSVSLVSNQCRYTQDRGEMVSDRHTVTSSLLKHGDKVVDSLLLF